MALGGAGAEHPLSDEINRGTVGKAERFPVLPAHCFLEGGALYASHVCRKTSAEAPAATRIEGTVTQISAAGLNASDDSVRESPQVMTQVDDPPLLPGSPLSLDELLAYRHQAPPT